jgi:hypothetical protein
MHEFMAGGDKKLGREVVNDDGFPIGADRKK